MTWPALAFGVLAGLTLLGAYKVVATAYITHAALYLALVLISVAGLFILLEAPFLGLVQIFIYVGAVIAVFVFAVMLSELREVAGDDKEPRGFLEELRASLRSPYLGTFPLAIAGLLVVLILFAVAGVGRPEAVGEAEASISTFGTLLFLEYVLPFEVAGLVLLVAMIGAIVLAKAGGGEAQ